MKKLVVSSVVALLAALGAVAPASASGAQVLSSPCCKSAAR